MKLIMLKGLPASGKSTYAKNLASKGYIRVNKDDLRAMLHNGKWSGKNEKQVLAIRDAIIVTSLSDGKSVVVDDTNLDPKHEQTLANIAKEYKASFETMRFDTDVEECIKRDLARANSVGERVIRRMYQKYMATKATPPTYNPDLPLAIICDIDGTLAHGIGITRGPYEWDKVGSDTVDKAIWRIVNNINCDVIFVSGRDGVCFDETSSWLNSNVYCKYTLYMRTAGDNRKDSIVKKEIYDQHIKGKYDILFVLDDRDQVVRMWRDQGLKCLQVDYGDF